MRMDGQIERFFFTVILFLVCTVCDVLCMVFLCDKQNLNLLPVLLIKTQRLHYYFNLRYLHILFSIKPHPKALLPIPCIQTQHTNQVASNSK